MSPLRAFVTLAAVGLGAVIGLFISHAEQCVQAPRQAPATDVSEQMRGEGSGS